jgi:excisionase family DNA binding protein
MQALFQLSYSPAGVHGSSRPTGRSQGWLCSRAPGPPPEPAERGEWSEHALSGILGAMKRHEIPQEGAPLRYAPSMVDDEIRWMSTGEAAKRLGVTVRTLYRLIDESQLPAYKFGRVIRLQESQVDAFIEASRIQPGSLEHLYPDVKREIAESDSSPT